MVEASYNVVRGPSGTGVFQFGTNQAPRFEIGARDSDDLWLLGESTQGPEFIFNGRLFLPGHEEGGTIIDNFPKSPAPGGWVRKPLIDGDGYSLVDDQANVELFAYEILDGKVCRVRSNLYDKSGNIIVEATDSGTDFKRFEKLSFGGGGGILVTLPS